MKELKHLRKRNEKHFLNDDGTISLYLYNNDIHYLKNGEYLDIDNALIEKENTIVAGPYHPEFTMLVEGAMWYDAILEKIKKMNTKVKEVEIIVIN